MPTLRVELFEGRTEAQKAELAKALTEACVKVLGGKADSVDILFFDIARQNWATGGALWSARSTGSSGSAGPADPTGQA